MNDNEKLIFKKALHAPDGEPTLPEGFNAFVMERIAVERRRREERTDRILLTLAGLAAGVAVLLAAVFIPRLIDLGALWSSVRNALSFDNLGLRTLFSSVDIRALPTIVTVIFTLLFYGSIIICIDSRLRRKAQ